MNAKLEIQKSMVISARTFINYTLCAALHKTLADSPGFADGTALKKAQETEIAHLRRPRLLSTLKEEFGNVFAQDLGISTVNCASGK